MSLLSERILNEIGPELPFYAILDGAQKGGVASWVKATRAPSWCLYEGELAHQLETVAPRLIRLGRGHPYFEELLADGFQQNWGVIIASAAPSRELRRHLRRFFLARTEDNRRLLFRYYDPRVLCDYLPALDAEELGKFFGPIQLFIAPDVGLEGQGDPLAFEVFRKRGPELARKRVVIEPPPLVDPAAQEKMAISSGEAAKVSMAEGGAPKIPGTAPWTPAKKTRGASA